MNDVLPTHPSALLRWLDVLTWASLHFPPQPFLYLERTLDEERTPAEHCCCRCCGVSLPGGLNICVYILCLEALIHLLASLLRERWTWTSTALTIVVYMLQTAVRVVMVPVALYAHGHLVSRRDQGLRLFFRFLVCAVLLEVVEMGLRFWEVHDMCARAELHGAGGITVAGAVLLGNSSGSASYTARQCEYLADTRELVAAGSCFPPPPYSSLILQWFFAPLQNCHARMFRRSSHRHATTPLTHGLVAVTTLGGIVAMLFLTYTAWLVHSVRVHLTNGTLDGAVVGNGGASSSASTSPLGSPRAGAPAPPTQPDPYGHAGTQATV